MNEILARGKKIFFSQQSSVLSAATIIMFMVVASRVLGLVRQRVLANFFTPNELSVFFAAFRLPDTVFEVLVYGTFASAFIPVFTSTFKKGEKEAWKVASSVLNIGISIFVIVALVVIIFTNHLYGLLAPGYGIVDRDKIVLIARILFAAQGFFVLSYVLTAVLESLRRFLIPAVAPLFYNLGIIITTILLAPRLGIMAPVLGVVIGAFLHFLIQLPLVLKLGFKFSFKINLSDEVKKIGKLALPRIIEVSFLQIVKTVELFLASLISTASYTYFTFGNTLQLLPVGLFGTSIAKAALPTLSRQVDTPSEFKKTLFGALNQVVFLVAPFATALIVLRIPLVRLLFGTDIFDWEATVQTSLVVSAFALGVVFQSAASILARAFYALHDTKTPVAVSIFSIIINIIGDFILVRGYGLPAWGLAAAFSFASFFQALVLYFLIIRRTGDGLGLRLSLPIVKSFAASLCSGAVMFFLLKFFDRYAWIKRLSFLGRIQDISALPFEKFVLDTRYTVNLIILTGLVAIVGAFTYLGVSLILRSGELLSFIVLVRRVLVKREVAPLPAKESEPVTPTPADSGPS